MSPRGRRKGTATLEAAPSARRAELRDLAAEMFAERGVRSTTVRDIADAAGILSGSLYHHFDSKESMVDEILSTFLDELWTNYREIMATQTDPRAALEAVVVESFECIDRHHAAVAIFQNESKYLARFERFSYLKDRGVEFRELWLDLLERGMRDGVFRKDVDPRLVYRFIRDTVWVAVSWYRPGGSLSARQVADQYLTIVLEGIATNGSSADG